VSYCSITATWQKPICSLNSKQKKSNTILDGHPESYAAFACILLAVVTFSFYEQQ
jgi:hypothetical protein